MIKPAHFLLGAEFAGLHDGGVIGYGRQCIDDEDIKSVCRVLRSDMLTGGPAVAEFEAALAARCAVPDVVAVSNGTSALRLLYQAMGIGPGSRVGVPAITFIATASQALLLGAEVTILDVDPDSMLLTPAILADCSEPLDVVVPVHVAGQLCDMAGLAEVAAQRGIRLLEDACHALGSTWADGSPCGNGQFSDGAVFSFHPVKNITTGEGGAIAVRDAAVAARLRSLRHHGIVREDFRGELAAEGGTWYHEFHQAATNERISDLQAALGLSQLQKLELFKAARQTQVERYQRELTMPWLQVAASSPDQHPFWHLCTVQIDWDAIGMTRANFVQQACAAGWAPQIHYIPLQHQPMLTERGRWNCPGADRAYRRLVTLPCHPSLSEAEQDLVIAFFAGIEAVRS